MISNDNVVSSKKFVCKDCDYITCRLSQYERHLLTLKHKMISNDNIYSSKSSKMCECGKKYKYYSGLSRHKKICSWQNDEYIKSENEEKPIDINNTNQLTSLVTKLMVENQEMKNIIVNENLKLQQQNQNLQKQVLDVCKNIQPNISNSNNNSNNKTFNLQFFLNEQCKDAMNITDFINSVTLSLTDLENMGTSGYVNGISSIIIKELRGLDITKRPVHCSDAKRETLYIKDEDKWEKECPENTKMKTAIRTVEKKNIKLISEWTDKHPKFTNSTTKENDEYLQILIETMGGKGDYEKNKNKIIKNIAKEVIIEK